MRLAPVTRRCAQLVRRNAVTGWLAGCTLILAACDKPPHTPDWLAGTNPPASFSPTPAAPAPVAATPADPADPAAPAQATPTPPTGGGLRFIAYNVENWLTMDRVVNRQTLKNAPKPAREQQTVVAILTAQAPDVVGLCEVGEPADLREIQAALKAAGLDLPHSCHVGGADALRHLALLSRFPITLPTHPAATDYQLANQTFTISRGILDATVNSRGSSYRFLGVHLKSKREIEEADQEAMRIHEARLLRRHVDNLLRADANARLVVYGDFNDTRPSKAFKIITSNYNDPGYLTAVPLRDSRGESWTHYWDLHEIYSRFDFVTVSRALKPEVDFRASHLVDDPTWHQASDHRPLLVIFR